MKLKYIKNYPVDSFVVVAVDDLVFVEVWIVVVEAIVGATVVVGNLKLPFSKKFVITIRLLKSIQSNLWTLENDVTITTS